MRVNIIYEVNNREYLSCLLIQRELVRRGYDARVYNKTENILFVDTSNCITIIPNSYLKSNLDHYRYAFNTNDGIVVVYPREQVTNHKMPIAFDYSDDNPVKQLPHLCWGQDYYDYIQRLGFTNKWNTIVGAIQLDFFRNEFVNLGNTREQIAKKYSLPIGKKWILFISDFVFNSEIISEQIIQNGEQSENIIRAKHSFSKKSCSKLLEWFEMFLSEHQDYIVIYRKHPVELLTKEIKDFEENNKEMFFAISDLNIREWIVNCDRIVSWYSTTIVECIAAHKNMILVRPYEMSKDSGFDEYDFYKDYPKATTYDEFCKATENNDIFPTENMKNIINNLYSIGDYPVFKRIADAIDTIAEHKAECCCISEKHFQIRRWKYLLLHCIPLKIIVKKGFQLLYNLFRCKFYIQGETKHAINEWIASANFNRRKKSISRKIDGIIEKI